MRRTRSSTAAKAARPRPALSSAAPIAETSPFPFAVAAFLACWQGRGPNGHATLFRGSYANALRSPTTPFPDGPIVGSRTMLPEKQPRPSRNRSDTQRAGVAQAHKGRKTSLPDKNVTSGGVSVIPEARFCDLPREVRTFPALCLDWHGFCVCILRTCAVARLPTGPGVAGHGAREVSNHS